MKKIIYITIPLVLISIISYFIYKEYNSFENKIIRGCTADENTCRCVAGVAVKMNLTNEFLESYEVRQPYPIEIELKNRGYDEMLKFEYVMSACFQKDDK